jgi:hypothetical protein
MKLFGLTMFQVGRFSIGGKARGKGKVFFEAFVTTKKNKKK